jgi:hypothetical protein
MRSKVRFFHFFFDDYAADECSLGVNPVCDDVARWASWKMGAAAKRYVASE